MSSKLIAVALIVVSFSAMAQYVPPDPDPGCDNILRIGMMLPNNQNTQYFVGGYSVERDRCDGLFAGVMYEQLNPTEYAFGMFDADLIYETTLEMVDFSFDLTNTLVNLPIGQHVKIAQLHSTHSLIADLTLKKIDSIEAVPSNPKGNIKADPYKWLMNVKWYEPFSLKYSEDQFVFSMDDLVEFNYILDDLNYRLPVSMISFGGDKISVNPFVNQSGELITYSLGFIDTSTPLYVGDKVVFDINWPSDGNVTE